jgi:hypothetical protein
LASDKSFSAVARALLPPYRAAIRLRIAAIRLRIAVTRPITDFKLGDGAAGESETVSVRIVNSTSWPIGSVPGPRIESGNEKQPVGVAVSAAFGLVRGIIAGTAQKRPWRSRRQ